jgi:hypothetical protein
MKSSESILLTSVYLPAKESKSHLTEYKEAIDQLYELHQKYNETQKINIGGDINEDLNEPTSTKRNLYLQDFINECCLKYDNKANTFVNSLGQESSEIDYFLHNLTDGEFQRKQVLHDMPENKSDHYPIRMSIKFKHQNVEVHRKQNNSRIARKINWDKVDKKWYSAHICTHIDNLQINENMEETAIEQAILKLCELLKETATLTSSAKTTFNAKPKLTVWTPEIRLSIKTARQKYKVWKDHGKPNDKSNIMLREKKQAKKEFRRTVRIEIAKLRNKEKENIFKRNKDRRYQNVS